MVERQAREFGGDFGTAEHDGDLVFLECLTDCAVQKVTEIRRLFGRFDDDAIAAGDGVDQRREGKLQRIVPRRDNADDPERLWPHPGRAGPEVEPDLAITRLHPPFHVLARVPDGGDQHHGFEQVRLESRPIAEVGRNRVGDRISTFPDHVLELVEAVDADAGGGRTFLALRCALQVQQACGVGHVKCMAVHVAACSVRFELSLSLRQDSSVGAETIAGFGGWRSDMRSHSGRCEPPRMLSFWVSNSVEGPGTRDAPRDLATPVRCYR